MSISLHVSGEDPTPPYEQLRRQIATAILSGSLVEGTKLPTVRAIAADLGIAPGTVMRTFSLLAEEGLIISRRGRGSVVAAAPIQDQDSAELHELASAFAKRARELGVDDSTALTAVVEALREGK